MSVKKDIFEKLKEALVSQNHSAKEKKKNPNQVEDINMFRYKDKYFFFHSFELKILYINNWKKIEINVKE